MTTQAWASVVDQSSDAGFRAWGLDLNTKLAAAGLVQTSDTGQIDWTTVNRAGTNSNAGYEIWRFNDSLQGTAPIFIKIEYGTGNSAAIPRIQISVGTGTNGAGTLTGTAASDTAIITSGNQPTSTAVAYTSYACHAEGFFGLLWKTGSSSNGAFLISRTCDSSGAPTATGALCYWGSNNSVLKGVQALRFAAAAAAYTLKTAANEGSCLVPLHPANSAVGADIQVYLHWTITPQVSPVFGFCTVYVSEIPLGNTFSTTLVGSTPRTYIGLGTGAGAAEASSSNANALAMLWE